MLLWLPHWRNIALYLGIRGFTDWLLPPTWLLEDLLLDLRLTVNLISYSLMINLLILLGLFIFRIVYKDLRLFIKSVDFLHLLLNV